MPRCRPWYVRSNLASLVSYLGLHRPPWMRRIPRQFRCNMRDEPEAPQRRSSGSICLTARHPVPSRCGVNVHLTFAAMLRNLRLKTSVCTMARRINPAASNPGRRFQARCIRDQGNGPELRTRVHTCVREICYGTNDAGQQQSGTSQLYAVFVGDMRRNSSVVGPRLMAFHVVVYLV